VVIALTEITDFRRRIVRDDVQFIALNKAPGHTLWIYPRLLELFRKLRPAIVHSRNLAALEVVVPAWAAGVPVRIHGERLRLVMIGDGPLRAQAQAELDQAGVAHLAWLPGERRDVADVMRGLHAFVLPSIAEGISNTILEAMASALPVIATDVGGNADLVQAGVDRYHRCRLPTWKQWPTCAASPAFLTPAASATSIARCCSA
jgi:glycosyltransferase involved in cell wall biosynthesis